MDRIPENVMINIQSYFKDNLPQYEVVKVRKKSWHKDDSHLLMVSFSKAFLAQFSKRPVWT